MALAGVAATVASGYAIPPNKGMNKPERIGKWNLWSLKPITKPGFYWIAGYFPENRRMGISESSEPEDVTIWEFRQKDLDDYASDTVILNRYAHENFIWFGPLHYPKFSI